MHTHVILDISYFVEISELYKIPCLQATVPVRCGWFVGWPNYWIRYRVLHKQCL